MFRFVHLRLVIGIAAALLAVPAQPSFLPTVGTMLPAVGAHPHDRIVHADPHLQFGCQGLKLDDFVNGPVCFSPLQMQRAYGFDKNYQHGLTGSGRTIVIIDAYQNPFLATDLAAFDGVFGLPAPSLTQVAPDGLTPFDATDATQVNWSGEIALDVEYAHAMAPGAAIALVLAKSGDDADIISATRYAVVHDLGDVISQSFGEGETCMTTANLDAQHAVFIDANANGITLIASSGDSGAAQPGCAPADPDFKSASTPASDPLVTGVGGTNLQADKLGNYTSERAWADAFTTDAAGNAICYPPSTAGCSGGGFSSLFERPTYQSGVGRIPSTARGVPDVAYNAGVDGGVLVHWGVGNSLFGLDPTDPTIYFLFGGTSAGSPAWAALVAIADQAAGHRLGNINPLLYSMAGTIGTGSIRDVTRGNNNFDDIVGDDAGPGWDPVTGLGSPDAQILVNALATGTKPPRGKP
jgi:subtilase family serine protease